jgi:hypothetical protein
VTEKTSGGVSREVKEGHVKRSGNILELAFLRSRCAFGILHHFRSFTWVGGLVMTLDSSTLIYFQIIAILLVNLQLTIRFDLAIYELFFHFQFGYHPRIE